MICTISPDYPNIPPEISALSTYLDRDTIKNIRDIVHQHAQDVTGSPMLLELVSLLQEQLSSLPKQTCKDRSNNRSDTEIVTLLIHIDHMRSRTRYVKTITKWVEELCLAGRIIFCNKLILLLIQGERTSLKEYMVRHKSVNIDIDSQGHPCKEKMMSVLSEKALPSSNRFDNFGVVECESSKTLRELFEKQKMEELFVDCVMTIKGFK